MAWDGDSLCDFGLEGFIVGLGTLFRSIFYDRHHSEVAPTLIKFFFERTLGTAVAR